MSGARRVRFLVFYSDRQMGLSTDSSGSPVYPLGRAPVGVEKAGV